MEARQSGWWASFFGSVKGTFRLNGRSTFAELAIYWLTAVLIMLAIEMPLGFLVDFELRMTAQDLFQLAAAIPLPALIVRRLHDQDRSGKFLWLALPGVALAAMRTAVSMQAGTDTRIRLDSFVWPLDWLATFTSLALIILMFVSGTSGPNRFGGDPRGRTAKSSGGELEPPAAN